MIRNILLSATGLFIVASASAAPASLYDLRTELLSNPIGIDAPKPRFSWKMKDARQGAHQQAYQIQVATTTESLTSGKPDLWDSGRQQTSVSRTIIYDGPPLKPRSFYVWRVKIWDQTGEETPYSNPAHWETGMLTQDQWKAHWIAGKYEVDNPDEPFKDVRWVWYPDGDPADKTSKGVRFFRYHFELADKPVNKATAWTLADNYATVYINGTKVAGVSGFRGINPVDITSILKPGNVNVIQVEAKNTGNNPAALAFCADIKFKDGSSQRVTSDPSWRTSSDPGKKWPGEQAGEGDGKVNWIAVLDVGKIGMEPWGTPNVAVPGPPASYFRKDFDTAAAPSRARLYITSLGSYIAEINGQRIGDSILAPGWTDYVDRVVYQTYDVTDLVKTGDNAVGVLLGDGWYGSGLGWGLERLNFGPAPTRFIAELHLDYPDGKHEVVVTDSSWKTAISPIQRSELYYGEIYDARKEQAGWSSAGFDDSKWSAVNEPKTSASIELSAEDYAPIRITKHLDPVAITEPTSGTYVFDMGQNMVGWAKLKVSGKAGDKVRLRFAEILNDDGTIYTENLRRADATDTYTLKGDGVEVYEPHFTYHGFRYVEVTGYPGEAPGKDAITGQVFHTDLPQTGTFESSDKTVNRVAQNTQWGLWGNLTSVPTDCPQRDERLGWTGDAEAIWKTASYLMDMEAFTEKWCRDLRDAQGPEGDYPNVAPRVISMNTGAPAWGDAGIILPYDTWQMYNDTKLLNEMWDSMEQWMKFIGEANPNFLWLERRGNDYGDWVPADSKTDKDLIATAFWAGDARMMSEMATAIGKPEKAREYDELYEKIKAAFQEKFIKPDGKIANGSQTCYVLALENGLVQPELQTKAVGHLVQDIRDRENHLSTGFLGSTHLLPVLSKAGKNSVAITLLLQKTYPSWGYMVAKGATTIWERWNSDTGDPSMNSFNHYNYGAVTGWMYGYLAGIRPLSPGFKHILIEPHPDARMAHAKAEYESPYGKIVSHWTQETTPAAEKAKQNPTATESENQPLGKLTLHVEIPANTTAKISLPTSDAAKAKLAGKALPAEMKPVVENGRVVLSAGAGKYDFVVER